MELPTTQNSWLQSHRHTILKRSIFYSTFFLSTATIVFVIIYPYHRNRSDGNLLNIQQTAVAKTFKDCLVGNRMLENELLIKATSVKLDFRNNSLDILCKKEKISGLRLKNGTKYIIGQDGFAKGTVYENKTKDEFLYNVNKGDLLQLNISPEDNGYYINSIFKLL